MFGKAVFDLSIISADILSKFLQYEHIVLYTDIRVPPDSITLKSCFSIQGLRYPSLRPAALRLFYHKYPNRPRPYCTYVTAFVGVLKFVPPSLESASSGIY